MSDLKGLIKKNSEYQRYKRILESVEELDCSKIAKEAKFLHAQRPSRALYKVKVSPSRLQDSILTDLSNRSRMIELLDVIDNNIELLGSAIKLCKKQLRSEYLPELKEYGKTKEERMDILDRMFTKGVRKLDEISAVRETLLKFISDIDKASYHLSGVRDTLRMMLDRKETVSV